MVYTLPDTALLKDSRPFFVPDFANPCVLQAHAVVRISRLGRSVSERFAPRYYDAVTVGVTFRADNLLAEAQRHGWPWETAVGFDGAAVIGSFTPLDRCNPHDCTFSVTCDGTPVQQGHTARLRHSIDRSLAYISRFYTLRQGDLLFTGAPDSGVPVGIDSHIEGRLDNTPLLHFNIK